MLRLPLACATARAEGRQNHLDRKLGVKSCQGPAAPQKLRTVQMASSAPQLRKLLPRGLCPSLWPPMACSLAEITPPSRAPQEDGGLRGTQTRDCGGLHGLLTISKQATCFPSPLGRFTPAASGSNSDMLVFFHIKFRPGRAISPHIFPTLGNSAFSFDNSTGVSDFFFLLVFWS